MDVTVQEQVQRGIEATAEKAGKLDILFNNAGVGGTMPFEGHLEDWKTIIDTNLWSVIYGVHTAVPIMLKQGFGHIVNTSSIAGIAPPPFQALYSLTKYGVTGLTECLRYEYADRGLYFSTICPANIATPIFNKGIDGQAHGELRIPDDAYPVERAASLILDRVAEHKGIIVVPEHPYTELWQGISSADRRSRRRCCRWPATAGEAFERAGHTFDTPSFAPVCGREDVIQTFCSP